MDKEKRILNAILETIEEGIYVIDQNYTVEYMNRQMVELFGEGTGEKCHRLLNNSDTLCPWCRASEVFRGNRLHWELFIPKTEKTFALTELPLKNPDGSVSKLCIFRDITERKKREAELAASEERYQNLFENVGVGVYISSKEGRFLDANQSFIQMLDYESKEELLNIDITRDLYVRPSDRRKFQEMIERDGRVVEYEVEFKKRDGTPITVLLTSHVRYDHQGNVLGYEGITVDQTERYMMEKKLREAHDFMNKVIQSSPSPIMAADLKGNIFIWNRAAEETLGYPASETIGKMHITKIYPEGLAFRIMKMIRSPEHGGVGLLRSHPMLYVRKDGEVIDGSLSAAMIYDDDGNEVATVGSFVDMTERIEMERTLRSTQEQLLQSEKLAAMGRLTSQIAHELNNPLFGIMNTLELLKSEIPPENKRRKLLDMSLSETVRLAEMLRKMLSFSKPDQEEKGPVNINTIIDELMLLHEKQLRENSIKLTSELAEGLPEIYASRNQMRQVFLNMISNARDAMHEGGTLTFRTWHQDGHVYIEISDTGQGIDKENLNRIFDSFFTTKDTVKGVGLGLSVCYGFIQDHGGDIRVNSSSGQGTTFIIDLPVHQAPEQEQQNKLDKSASTQ
ncbi:MAG: PAS domain S-box protein [Desulfobacterales bacterium]|nr:PAS domain S-box protein [Desulfobacterales bacterium]MBS3754887.1 PAS domain S-box protein [Desulfobacterales bacterium]